ncbi:DNA gyrase inhibitor YacG [Rhabdochromatium marinum]|uniref:DNA gyrase inhibitor YacG n=1 Tax=Rhabdochromatium marinum TaxID=48729 RepID=UPI001906637E|nr:DNA gyrase inhibitor YacG [Rhabdochromatium marinum]MBK1650243.1 DNA gyrase inhibitor YacG [Rhabdochromatium marinum]
MPSTVSCPTCGRTVPWTPESRWRPFCSQRCRLIDLGDWLDESHCIPGEPVYHESYDESSPAPDSESAWHH